MPASEARIAASRANGARSRGPVTASGREISRGNAYCHGLSGDGPVIAARQQEEVERLASEYEESLRPSTPTGAEMVRRMATLAVRMRICERHENASRARAARHAAEAFADERLDRVENLYRSLGEDLRGNLRQLRKMPEGVDRMVEAWTWLRAELTCDPEPVWTARHLEEAANLIGLAVDHARSTRLGTLSRGSWGDFGGLSPEDGEGLDGPGRQAWCRARLIERIDQEIEVLRAHRETLDLESIELDRAEAAELALFDTSPEACLARRYEASAERGFFKCLAEFRRVEAEAAERAELAPPPPPPQAPMPPPRPVPPPEPLTSSTASSGSFGREPSPPLGSFRPESRPAFAGPVATDYRPIQGSPDVPMSLGRSPILPG